MDADGNRAIIKRLYADLFREWRTELIDELFDPGYRDHLLNRPEREGRPGPAGVHDLYAVLRGAFPDLDVEVHDIVAEGDRVVVRWSWTCTHLGEFRGIAPTGRQQTVEGIAIYRLADGRIVERWVSTNLDALAERLQAPEVAG